MFELYDKRRCEVLGCTETKADAVEMGKKALTMSWPSRRLEDLVIRPTVEPPIRSTVLPGFLPQKKSRNKASNSK